MADSPIVQLLAALDGRDVEAVIALLAPQPRLLAADGRRAEGTEPVRELMAEFLDTLRATAHRITAEWHVEDAWIAQVEADYELQDWLQLKALPRVFILRTAADGIAEVSVYGAHEERLTEHRSGEEGMLIGRRWIIPPL